MKLYKVAASSMTGTYSAGTFAAESKAEAIEKARKNYRNSGIGRSLNDVGAFRFYVTETIEN